MALAWANSLGNQFPFLKDETWRKREDRYLEIVGRYKKEEWEEMATLMGALILLIERDTSSDLLGQLHMSLEMANEHIGQFFTPPTVCEMMARLTLDNDLGRIIEEKGFATVLEPCAGSGTMLIALANEVLARGLNPQQCVWFCAWDLSLTSVHMTYCNLALRGLPGRVVHGNSLTMEVHSVWHTPAHFLNGFQWKVK